MKKVLLIEDEKGLQITLEDRLTAEGYHVAIESNGITGEKRAKEEPFAIVLLDIMLPGRDGFAVCKNLRKAGCFTPVLMLTARTTDLDIVMGLRQGADDYLAKPFDMGVLLARMEALVRRSSEFGTPISGPDSHDLTPVMQLSFGEYLLDREKKELHFKGKSVPLHTLEYRLLEYLVTHPNSTHSRNDLLDQVWGFESETTTRTVDVHIARLRHYLHDSHTQRYIQTVHGEGYRFTAP